MPLLFWKAHGDVSMHGILQFVWCDFLMENVCMQLRLVLGYNQFYGTGQRMCNMTDRTFVHLEHVKLCYSSVSHLQMTISQHGATRNVGRGHNTMIMTLWCVLVVNITQGTPFQGHMVPDRTPGCSSSINGNQNGQFPPLASLSMDGKKALSL